MFIVGLENSLRFAKITGGMQTFENTLSYDLLQPGLLAKRYFQKIEKGESKTIQFLTDYDGTIEAKLINPQDGSEIALTINEKSNYPDAYPEPFNTYEFEYTFNINSCYYIDLTGEDSEQENVLFRSEPINVADSFPNSLLIEYFNVSNTEFTDYSTGLRHSVRIDSRLSDTEDETDQNIYDNQNRKDKTYSATTFNRELISDPIPDYLIRQLTIAQGLKYFYINGVRHTVSDREPERFGQTILKQTRLICAEYETPGTNSDDSGLLPQPVPEMEQNTFPINLLDVSGNQEITVSADYMTDVIMYVLKTGTTATIKAGTTIGGDDILSPRTITTANPVSSNDREVLKKPENYGNDYKVYFTITGIGATVDINTIIKKYK